MTRTLLIAMLAFAFVMPRASSGDALRTLDGRAFVGEVRLEAGDAVSVRQAAGPVVRVKLADVLEATFGATASTTRPAGSAGPQPIRGPWAARDVGRPAANGAKRTATTVTVVAGALGATADAVPTFAFPLKGDGEVVARIADLSDDLLTAGLLLRGGPEADAASFYFGLAGPARNGRVVVRASKGEPAKLRRAEIKPQGSTWVRLTRQGNFVAVAHSSDGRQWRPVADDVLELPADVTVAVVCVDQIDGDKELDEARRRREVERREREKKEAPPEQKPPQRRPPGKAANPPEQAAATATFDSLRALQSPAIVGTGLRGEYFGGERGTERLLSRVDPTINFGWGAGSPDPAVPADKFTVRWSGQLRPPFSGKYQLIARADDRVSVSVDGKKLFDNGGTATVELRGGRPVELRVQYREDGGDAFVNLEWQADRLPRQPIDARHLFPAPDADADGAGEGLRAEYFADTELAELAVVRVDAEVNFQQDGPPVEGLQPSFSARWTGTVTAPRSGKYTFFTFADDGMRLWVDNKQLVDNWKLNPGVEDAGSIELEAGRAVPVRVESFNGPGGWVARLLWEGPDVEKQVVPTAALRPPGEALDTRVVTRDGSELTGVTIASVDDTTVRLRTESGGPLSLPVDRVARLSVRPLTTSLLANVPAGSPGVLLAGGDFFEGVVERVADRRVTVNSLIFGPRTFGLRSEVVAIVWQDVRPEPADYVVRTTDGSVYMAGRATATANAIVVDDRAAGEVTVPAEMLREIRYGGARVVPLADLPATASGAMQVDGSTVGLPMRLTDAPLRRGIGLAPGASATFQLNGQFRTFLATAGVPAAMLPTGRARFVAAADGKEVFRSPPRTSVDDALPVSLKVAGVNALTLTIEMESLDDAPMPGVWGEAILTKP